MIYSNISQSLIFFLSLHKFKSLVATPILVAAKRGVLEMVDKILEDMPVAALDQDQDEKNIILLAVENRQPRVYELMLKRKLMRTAVFSAVDKGGNSALHLAARHGSNRPWLIPGAALQMQWEIKWYKVHLSLPLSHTHISYARSHAWNIIRGATRELTIYIKYLLIRCHQSIIQ